MRLSKAKRDEINAILNESAPGWSVDYDRVYLNGWQISTISNIEDVLRGLHNAKEVIESATGVMF